MRVLFVEDCTEQSDFWVDRLRAANVDVTLAVRGVDAIVAATDLSVAPFDAVLMDISLGDGMSGVEAAARLRVARPGLPVIFMSAHDDGDTLEQAKLAHPAGYLIKPFEFKDLLAAIERGTSHAMPDTYSDHDLLVRIDVRLDMVTVQLNEARALVSAKADQETLEPRLTKIEGRLDSVILKVAMIAGGLIVIEALFNHFGK